MTQILYVMYLKSAAVAVLRDWDTRLIFLRCIKLNQYFLYMRKCIFKFAGALIKRKINIEFLITSLKSVTVRIIKIVPKAAPNSCTGFLALMSLFSPVYIQSRLLKTIFRITITSGFRNNFLSYRRLSVNWNKLPEEVYWQNF
jgi:hypothetical protein